MKAFSITEPGSSALLDMPQPHPGPGEVLLRSRLIGLCGTDLSSFRGKNPLVTYPRIPGHEIAATIVELGSDVPEHLQPGADATVLPYIPCGKCAACKRGRQNACKFNETLGVQRDGAMAGYFVVPWNRVYPAEGLSLRELSLVEPLGVGFHASERARITSSDIVAVIGSGTIGLGALASASAKGATTIAIDLEDGKLALARRAGAQHTINSRTHSVHDELLAITNGFGPDVVIEAVGVPDTYRMAVEEVAHTGRVVYIGWAKEPVSYETKLFVHKELDIMGSRNSLAEFPAVIEVLRQEKFPVEETISMTVPLEEAGSALKNWSEAPQSITKILVEIG
jgi:threonine dehydrogenase-like Zn-dependent dehydrogenase